MFFAIAKQFEFSASHQLDHLAKDHPCARLHGHNYIVIVELQGTLDKRDFVLDYGELKPFKEMIDNTFDHRHLNDILKCRTTAENIAKYLFDFAKALWPQVVAVRVSETPKTWAEFRQHED